MTDIQKQHGPWAWQPPKEWGVNTGVLITQCASDRLNAIKASTDPEWLRAVVADRDSQVAVRTAADRRLRKLQKARQDAQDAQDKTARSLSCRSC